MSSKIQKGTASYGILGAFVKFIVFAILILGFGIVGLVLYFGGNEVVGSLLMGLTFWIAGSLSIFEGRASIKNILAALVLAVVVMIGFMIVSKGIAGPIMIFLSLVALYLYSLWR